MMKNSEYFPPVTEIKGHMAVLFLPAPQGSERFVGWHWRKIAGVPFLLRNILNIQRGGVRHLVLMTGEHSDAAKELGQRLLKDPRVTVQLDWPKDSFELAEIASEKQEILLLDGALLHDKNQIKSAVELKTDPKGKGDGSFSRFRLDPDAMSTALKQLERFDVSGLEDAKKRSLSSESGEDGEQLLVYFPVTDQPKISSAQDFETTSEKILEKSSGLANDSFVTRVLSRPISKQLTRLLLNTRFTPNQITVVSFILGLGSALCFFKGGYGMGIGAAGLLLLSIWVDGVDGEIARIKFMESPFGAKLDIICDNVVHVAVFFAIGVGLYNVHGEKIYMLLGFFAAAGSSMAFILMSEGIIAGKSTTGAGNDNGQEKNSLIDKLANRDFTHFLFVLAVLNLLPIFIWLTAVGTNLMALFLLLSGGAKKNPA
jgi:phosphatidylglycerophosphate synthase